MKMDDIIKFVQTAKGLKLKSEQIWSRIKQVGLDKIYAFEKLPSTYFAEFFLTVIEMDLTESQKELLFDQLGRHVPDMHPDSITETFDVMINKQYITSPNDHLFERHYLRHFWKTPGKFSARHFVKIIRGLKKLNYVQEDDEFFIYEFMPYINEFIVTSDKIDELSALLIEVSELREYGLPEEETRKAENVILERLTFLEQKSDLLKQTEFVEIVRSDLAEYKRLKINGEL